MALTLYHNDMSVCAQKVRLCLAEKALAYEDKHLNLRAGDQKRPEFLGSIPMATCRPSCMTTLSFMNPRSSANTLTTHFPIRR